MAQEKREVRRRQHACLQEPPIWAMYSEGGFTLNFEVRSVGE